MALTTARLRLSKGWPWKFPKLARLNLKEVAPTVATFTWYYARNESWLVCFWESWNRGSSRSRWWTFFELLIMMSISSQHLFWRWNLDNVYKIAYARAIDWPRLNSNWKNSYWFCLYIRQDGEQMDKRASVKPKKTWIPLSRIFRSLHRQKTNPSPMSWCISSIPV